jgi:DNA-binding response OmpR family regulator
MSEDYDAIVLVFPLVHVVAADLCRTLRAAGVATPILLLAESGAVDDILTSLNAGASDFLIKPVPAGRMLERLGTFRRRVINLSSDSCKQVV